MADVNSPHGSSSNATPSIFSRAIYWGTIPNISRDDQSASSGDEGPGVPQKSELESEQIGIRTHQTRQSTPPLQLLEQEGQNSAEMNAKQEKDENEKGTDLVDFHKQQQLHRVISPLGQPSSRGLQGRQSSFFQANWASEVRNSNNAHALLFRDYIDGINRFRSYCGVIVNHDYVQSFIVFLIAINALMLGVATYKFVWSSPHLTNVFNTLDLSFLIIFTIELALQFCYMGWRLIRDGWLVFDLVIIVTSWSFATVQIVRAFRIFRALRLITRIKVMKNLMMGTFRKGNCLLHLVVLLGGLLVSSNLSPKNSFPFKFFLFTSPLWCHTTDGSHWTNVVFDFLYLLRSLYRSIQTIVS